MKKSLIYTRKLLLLLLALSILISSVSGSIVTSASEYSITAAEGGIYCELDGQAQHDIFLFVKNSEGVYCVVESDDASAILYYIGTDGIGAAYTGVYDGKYYNDGALGTAGAVYYVVLDGMLYKVSANGSAVVYIRDSSKTGTYYKTLGDKCYKVSYSTGEATGFTGVYSGKYYKAGELGTSSSAYYKVFSGKLYKVSTDGTATVYKKDTSKSGAYVKLVDGVYYSVGYKTGEAVKLTGVYNGKYYKSGKVATSSSVYYKVYNDKLYKISTNGTATVYKKDTKKSGTYKKTVDGVCYNVSYKTGAATAFTGIYNNKFYKSGKLTNGWQTVNSKKYYCKSGVPVKGINKIDGKVYYFDSKGVKYTGTGWKTVNKKKYYFTKGVAKTDWAIISKKLYHFSSGGVMSKSTKIDGISLDANGKATGPKKKYVPMYAKLLAAEITSPSNSKKKNLRICFDYVMNNYRSNGNPRIPHYTKIDWIYVYAYDMFGDRGGGNCFSYAAAFAFLAKECGYDEVYACNSGGHGWVEIDGKVYDPEQYKDVGKKIYALDYSNSKISNYKGAIAAYEDNPWMRVKIPDNIY